MDLQTLSRTTKSSTDAATSDGAAQRVPKPRRRWVTRVLLPVAVVLSVLMLIAYASRDLILPARQVEVVRVVAIAGSTSKPGDTDVNTKRDVPTSVVAQAPGWVEPDPYPTYVTALANGVVQHILVLEGESVKAGQTVVQLVKDDAELSLAKTRAELDQRRATLAAAEADFKEPVALVRAEAVAKAGVAEAKANLMRLDAEIAKENARLDELSAAYDRLKAMNERSVSALQVEGAKYQVKSQEAVVKATRQRKPELLALLESAEASHVAAKRDLELKTTLQKAMDESKAALNAAKVRVNEAELRLQRMTIKSPVDGVVMARLVSPGAKLMLGSDQPHSAHAIHLYDPAKLQVRVDVPLADAAAVGVGQRAKIVVDVLPNIEFDGVVTRIVHQADIAKNTVQFKVAIDKPAPQLKPDMLARVKFLSSDRGGSTSLEASSSGTTAVAIQRNALIQGQQPAVWWVSPENSRIERRPIKLGAAFSDDSVMVSSGLNPGDVIINNPQADLEAGQRVRYDVAQSAHK